MAGAEGSSGTGAGGRPLAVAAMVVVGGVCVAGEGPKPHTEQAPEPCGLLRVQRGQAQRCSSLLLSRRILLRSGFCRGASQMEQRGAAPAFRKVQRPHDHSLSLTAAAMEPGEWEWLGKDRESERVKIDRRTGFFVCSFFFF